VRSFLAKSHSADIRAKVPDEPGNVLARDLWPIVMWETTTLQVTERSSSVFIPM